MMSVNAVIITSKENALTGLNFSNEKLNFLDASINDDNDEEASLNEDDDDDDEDCELEEEEEDGENNVLLKSKRATVISDSYVINKNRSNFSSSSSLASSSNSLIQNNNELFLDAQEFNEDTNLFLDTKNSNKLTDISVPPPPTPTQAITTNTSNKNENLTIKKVDSYVELNLKRTSMSTCFNANKNKYGKRYDYDGLMTGVMGAYSSKKLLNSMSRSISKSNISKSSAASFASNCLSSSSITPLSSTSFTSLFVNTTTNLFADENRLMSTNKNCSNNIETSNPIKKMKISLFPEDIKMETNPIEHNSIDKPLTTQSKLKSFHLKFNRKVKASSKKSIQNCNSNSNSNAITLKKSLKTSKISTNPNLNASNTYANKFIKLNNEINFNFSKSYISKKSKKNASTAAAVKASLSNLSNFSSLANSTSMIPMGRKLKCLLVGDSRVGKTALMFLFLKRFFQSEYQPTIVDDYEGLFVLLFFIYINFNENLIFMTNLR
jgi:hypothetical protein